MADLPKVTLAQPRTDVPVGRVQGNSVYWDPAFMRSFMTSLYQRVGKDSAPSNDVLGSKVDTVDLDLTDLQSDVATLAGTVGSLVASQGVQDTHLSTLDSEVAAIQDELSNPYVSLGVTGSLVTDLTQGTNFLVGPLTGNCTLANPTGAEDGKTYTWLVKQNGSGGHSVTLDTKFVKATRDTFSQAANGITQMVATYNAADDKFYIAPLQIVGGAEWQTLSGTSGNIDTDLSIAKNAYVGPITGNVTIRNPTNPIDGEVYTWLITQDGTGGWTITLGTKFAKSALTFSPDTTLSTATVFSAKYGAANDKYYVFAFQTKVS